jgi:transcriptional antiterminator RfaH
LKISDCYGTKRYDIPGEICHTGGPGRHPRDTGRMDDMKHWYAVYTKPKAEDATAHLLSHAGIEVLNPKMRVKKYLRKKYAEAIEQLFPCYVFANFDTEMHSHMIKYTRGVRYVVGKEHPLIVHPEIISAIKTRMKDGVVQPESVRYSHGDKVMIKEGPFKDFYGIFQRRLPGRDRAMILLEAIYATVEIEQTSIKSA